MFNSLYQIIPVKIMPDSIINFRDIGGYETHDKKMIKNGMIFRSGSTDQISKHDLSFLKSIGLKTIIDLRPHKEQRPKIKIDGIDKISIPFDIEQLTKERTKPFLFKKGAEAKIINAVKSVYEEMPERLVSPVNSLFKLLCNEGPYPLLINCRAGKDRTGFAVALIQLALGMSEDLIIQDYLKSNQYILPRAEKMLWFPGIISFGKFPVSNFKIIYTAYEEYIKTVISTINNSYGGINGYLNYAGIVKADMATFNTLLLK